MIFRILSRESGGGTPTGHPGEAENVVRVRETPVRDLSESDAMRVAGTGYATADWWV
jgi:hypothetical protein